MITVGIRNLRNSLSKYINIVKTGEKILITDHNRIVAELRPSEQIEQESSLLKEYLDTQIRNGSIIKSTRKNRLKRRSSKNKSDQKSINKIYKETRNERI